MKVTSTVTDTMSAPTTTDTTDADEPMGVSDLPRWRVGLLCLSTVLVVLLAIVALTTVSGALAPYSPLPDRIHTAAVGLAVVAVTYTAYRRTILRRPAAFFMIRRPGPGVIGWTAAGLALPLVVLGVHFLVNDIQRVGTVAEPALIAEYVLASVAAGLLAGVLEEVAFRGYLFRLIEERWNPAAAVVTTAVIFAALHQGHAASAAALAMVTAAMLAAGVLLALVVYRTRSVANAVVVHAGWNTVFGGRIVSVGPDPISDAAILTYRLAGENPLLSGGDATLAAAPLTTAILVLATIALIRFDVPWCGPDGR